MSEHIELEKVDFPRRPKFGIVLGLELWPMVFVGVMLLLSLVLLYALPFPFGLVVFIVNMAITGFLGWTRIKSRNVFAWARAIVERIKRKQDKQDEYRLNPGADAQADARAEAKAEKAYEKAVTEALQWGEDVPQRGPKPISLKLPGAMNEFKLYRTPNGLGMVHDPARRRISVTALMKNTRAFTLQDDQQQGDLIDSYGNSMDVGFSRWEVAGIIDSDVTSVQTASQARDYYQSQASESGAGEVLNPVAHQGYLDYLSKNLMTYHPQYKTFVLDLDQMKTQIKEAGGSMAGLVHVADYFMESLASDLAANGFHIERWLDPRERLEVVYEACTGEREMKPVGARDYWNKLRINECVHRTFIIDEWPQKQVTPGFMRELTQKLRFRHTVTLVFERGNTENALRKVNNAIQDKDIAMGIQEKMGRRVSLETKRELGDLERLEAELTSGATEVMPRGFISITAGNDDELESNQRHLMAAANRAGLKLLPCYNQQTAAFFAAAGQLGVGLD